MASSSNVENRFTQQTYGAREANFKNATAKALLRIIDRKQTNLCVSVDVTRKRDVLAIVDAVGKDVALIKTHIDIIEDFDQDLVDQLTQLSQRDDFLIFEDRKFADIGNTVSLQYSSGVHKIASWSHITNAHLVPGPGIISGLKKVGQPLGRALLLLAEMSSAGTLAKGDYSKACVEESIKDDDGYVIGFIATSRVDEKYASNSGRDFLVLTPGIGLEAKGDSMGQQYQTPDQAVKVNGSDVIIVGRGIYSSMLNEKVVQGDEDARKQAADTVRQQCERYRKAGWDAYQDRIRPSLPISISPLPGAAAMDRSSSRCRPYTSDGVSVVFGYGSLIFKPPPHTIGRTVGYIKGYARRFAQSSNDHRGTLAKPGRVATLVCASQWHSLISNDDPPEGDIVWGVAWHIDPKKSHEVRRYLDHREQNGYTAQSVNVYRKDENGEEVVALTDVLIYVGLPDNEAFVGPSKSLKDLAEYIFTCEGPSGRNDDYVLKLAVACRTLSLDVQDSHLFTLEKLLLDIRRREGLELSLISCNDKQETNKMICVQSQVSAM